MVLRALPPGANRTKTRSAKAGQVNRRVKFYPRPHVLSSCPINGVPRSDWPCLAYDRIGYLGGVGILLKFSNFLVF